jgi:cytochrome oxidase Cu insertion factor (SCO1/SenC/PrrC family)
MTCAAKPIFLALLMAQIAARPIDPQTMASRARLSDLAVLDLNGHAMRYSKLSGKVTVVAFISTRCPMSNAFNSRLNALYNEFEKRVKFIAVNSNANESLDEVRRHALRLPIEAVLQHRRVPMPETHSLGCAIKRTRSRDN